MMTDLSLQAGSIMPILLVFRSASGSKSRVCWWMSIRMEILDM